MHVLGAIGVGILFLIMIGGVIAFFSGIYAIINEETTLSLPRYLTGLAVFFTLAYAIGALALRMLP